MMTNVGPLYTQLSKGKKGGEIWRGTGKKTLMKGYGRCATMEIVASEKSLK